MKQEILRSILAVTAGMSAGAIPFNAAYAKPPKAEKQLPGLFQLKLMNQVRLLDRQGNHRLGSLILDIDQTPFRPEHINHLKAEMQGFLYFQEDGTKETWPLIGTDGEALLDLIHKSDFENVYQIYGCNSTWDSCVAQAIQLKIRKDEILLDFEPSVDSQIEILTSYRNYPDTTTTSEEWVRSIYNANMKQVSTK